jgi:hypothetical protein
MISSTALPLVVRLGGGELGIIYRISELPNLG